MKITKLGRERPVLYRGKLAVPKEVMSRLAVASNHFALSEIAGFNGQVDQYYLVIDNLLSAVVIAKEGTLTTTNHHKKIEKFFTHFARRAKIRSIDQSDFLEFHQLWNNSRYRLYFPDSATVWRMRQFSYHLFQFSITEIARFFKSDEVILRRKIDKLLEIYPTCSILEEASIIHERTQMRAEEFGNAHGYKLGMKLANPWNFITLSLLSDRQDITRIIDNSKQIRGLLKGLLEAWDGIISKIQTAMFEQLTLEIAYAKMKKKGIRKEEALREALEAVPTHPRLHEFRLALGISIDVSEPHRMGSHLVWSLLEDEELEKHPRKTVLDSWERYKKYSRKHPKTNENMDEPNSPCNA
jgi:hypothetical protein